MTWNEQNSVNVLGNVQRANHVDLLHMLYWFGKNILVDITKAFLGPSKDIKLSTAWKMVWNTSFL